ncbi:MAG: hypothetical protein AAF749_14815 [Pseudomonadota bacterium]
MKQSLAIVFFIFVLGGVPLIILAIVTVSGADEFEVTVDVLYVKQICVAENCVHQVTFKARDRERELVVPAAMGLVAGDTLTLVQTCRGIRRCFYALPESPIDP